jgi:hypothetical protein
MRVQSAEHVVTVPDWIDVPPVFIVGAPRSGTTLMRLMLTAHRRMSIASEGAYVYLPTLLSRRDPHDMSGLEPLYLEILPHLEKEQFLSPPTFGDLFDWVTRYGSDVRSILTFYGTWEARILGKRDLSWWGDNAPYHVHHIPFFDATFPGCKFIVMIRDPRDACASSKASFAWHQLDAAIANWELAVVNGLMGELYLGSARVKRVKYESLIRRPAEELQNVCGFLDVEYTDHMLAYHESRAAKAIGRLSHHKNVLSSVFASSIGKYRERLTSDEIAVIEKRLGTSMVGLGYMSYQEYADTRPAP